LREVKREERGERGGRERARTERTHGHRQETKHRAKSKEAIRCTAQ